MAEISAQTDAGNTVTLVGMGEDEADVDITDASTVSAIEFVESHGRSAVNITVGDMTYEGARLGRGDVIVKDSGGSELGTFVEASPAGQLIARAGWNYFLIERDGVHKPVLCPGCDKCIN